MCGGTYAKIELIKCLFGIDINEYTQGVDFQFWQVL